MSSKRKHASESEPLRAASESGDKASNSSRLRNAQLRAELARRLQELDENDDAVFEARVSERAHSPVEPAPPFAAMAAAINAEFTNERIEVNADVDALVNGELQSGRYGKAFTYTFEDTRGRKYEYVMHVSNVKGHANRLVLNYNDAASGDKCVQPMAASRFARFSSRVLGVVNERDAGSQPFLSHYLPLPESMRVCFLPQVSDYGNQRARQLWDAFQFLLFERAFDLALRYLAIMLDELPESDQEDFNHTCMNYRQTVQELLRSSHVE